MIFWTPSIYTYSLANYYLITIRNLFENFLHFETVLVAGTAVVFEEKTVDYQETAVVVVAVEEVELKVCAYFCLETPAVF